MMVSSNISAATPYSSAFIRTASRAGEQERQLVVQENIQGALTFKEALGAQNEY